MMLSKTLVLIGAFVAGVVAITSDANTCPFPCDLSQPGCTKERQLEILQEKIDQTGVSMYGPKPDKPVELFKGCCYEFGWNDAVHQVCDCLEWNAICDGYFRFSDCCGPLNDCWDHCRCVPQDRICGSATCKETNVCDDPRMFNMDAVAAMDPGTWPEGQGVCKH